MDSLELLKKFTDGKAETNEVCNYKAETNEFGVSQLLE